MRHIHQLQTDVGDVCDQEKKLALHMKFWFLSFQHNENYMCHLRRRFGFANHLLLIMCLISYGKREVVKVFVLGQDTLLKGQATWSHQNSWPHYVDDVVNISLASSNIVYLASNHCRGHGDSRLPSYIKH